MRQLAFQTDGKILALGQSMDAVAFWEVTQGKLFSPANVPASIISGLQFSAKDELFVASEDGMMAWWNPRSAAKLRDVKLEFADHGPMDYFPGDIVPDRFFRDDRFYSRRGGGGFVTLSSGAEILATGDGGMYSFFDGKTGKLLYDEDAGRFNGQSVLSFFDGDAKVAAIQMKRIRVWNARSGRDLDKFDLPLRDQEQAIRLAASPSGKHFAIATTNDQGQGRTMLWDASLKRIAREWITQDRQEAMRFSPDQQWLALGGAPNRLLLVRAGAAKGDYPLSLGVRRAEEITELAFSPDGRQLACAAIVPVRDYESGRIFVFELASKKVRLELTGHRSGIIDRLAYAPNSGLLASGATDTTVLVWQAGLRAFVDRKSTRLNSSHIQKSRMPSSA